MVMPSLGWKDDVVDLVIMRPVSRHGPLNLLDVFANSTHTMGTSGSLDPERS
mgnify:CR=1 FL=1